MYGAKKPNLNEQWHNENGTESMMFIPGETDDRPDF